MAKARAISATKVKKKNWFPILAPKLQNNVVLGESYLTEADAAIGKIVHANLRTITDNMRDQNMYLTFKISHKKDNNLHTEVTGFYMTPPSIKKIARRNTGRVDDSFVVQTKDGKKIRIKPVAITIHIVPRSVRSALRLKIQDIVARECASLDFANVIKSVSTHQLQTTVKKKCAKIYPLRAFQIKVLEYAKEGKTIQASEEQEQSELKKEAKEKKEKKPKKTVTEEMAEELAMKAQEAKDSEDFGE